MRSLTVSVLTIHSGLRISLLQVIATKTYIVAAIFLQQEKHVSRTNSFRINIKREDYSWNESSTKMTLTNSQLNDLHHFLRNRATKHDYLRIGSKMYYKVSRADNVLFAARSFISQRRIRTSNLELLALRSCNQLVRMGKISMADKERYRQIQDNRYCLVYVRWAWQSCSIAWNRADVVLIDRS